VAGDKTFSGGVTVDGGAKFSGGFDTTGGAGLATVSLDGFVKADRIIDQAITGDVYGGLCATITNLVLGRRYLLMLYAIGRADSGAGVGSFQAIHDAVTILQVAVNFTGTNLDLPASGTAQFVATASASLTLNVNAGTASGVRSRGGNIILLEMNSPIYGAL
jgi:hypothetical protein